ncbi:zinc-binding dehydrogenase [Allokutzneria sp. A3M-2-11 16]|uniref:zinc-binding dehydrogenase n=1 Tax=Allokutzneria sp. A3M-2-11 16 TaxID=2962043 RepID=UPI0020B75D5F|nr:zinc-binding dehydrogenase [Allokutzneria sp. A3M-2-11 16]MCP3800616.1 zinc-binding dehydrogenase [Allokutzneria sp. A3M-2-11 16]
MRAIRQYEFGPAENLLYQEVPDPVPGEGQVRIRVAASGVHLIDTTIRSGTGGGPMPLPELPMTPGREVAGVVDALGPDTDPVWLGRRVVAHLGMASGGYAELAVANAESLYEIPSGVEDGAAVAMIGTGRTTMAVLDAAAITASDVVLVTAAAGGIGNLLVQHARNIGATVVGLAGGSAKVDLVRGLGAEIAVDYTQEDWAAQVRSELGDRAITLVLDSVGGPVGQASLDLLGAGGRIYFFGWSAGETTKISQDDLWAKSITAGVAIGPAIVARAGGLRVLERRAMDALAKGELVPLVNPPIPLSDAAAAHTALVSRATIGKVILIP